MRILTVAVALVATILYGALTARSAQADIQGLPRNLCGFRWDGSVGYWRFSDPWNRPLDTVQGIEAIRSATESWNNATSPSFSFQENGMYDNVVRAGRFGVDYPEYNDANLAITGWAILNAPFKSSIIQEGWITFNSNKEWVTDWAQNDPDNNRFDVRNVATHELGHWGCLVDNPPNHNESVMSFNSAAQKYSLADYDRKLVRVLYAGVEAIRLSGTTVSRVGSQSGTGC